MRRSFAPLALLLLTPTPALAVNVAFELSPGVAFPIGSFIDDFPLPVDDVTPFLRAFGFPVVWAPDDPNYQETAGAVRLDATSDPGFAIGLGVLLDNWELRYNLLVRRKNNGPLGIKLLHSVLPVNGGRIGVDFVQEAKDSFL